MTTDTPRAKKRNSGDTPSAQTSTLTAKKAKNRNTEQQKKADEITWQNGANRLAKLEAKKKKAQQKNNIDQQKDPSDLAEKREGALNKEAYEVSKSTENSRDFEIESRDRAT